MQSQEEYLAQWSAQLEAAKQQLGYFESGKMRWKMNGVDRSDAHIAALKRIIGSIEQLLAAFSEGLPPTR